MDMLSSGSDSSYNKYWVDWFLGTKGNEFFCEIDDEYLLDRFNLTGLSAEVQYYAQAMDLITDQLEEELPDEVRDAVEKSARHLYGLVHARFIITGRGLAKMMEKYKKAEFGRCPRVLCHNQPTLPVGLSDIPYTKSVKLYCPRCEDIYTPKSVRHAQMDGAYFGATFPHLLLQQYPDLLNFDGVGTTRRGVYPRGVDNVVRYVPKIFGFKIAEVSREHKSQDEVRKDMERRLGWRPSAVDSKPNKDG